MDHDFGGYRRNFRQQAFDRKENIDLGTLGYQPPYKDYPKESLTDTYIAKLKDENKSPYVDYFAPEERNRIFQNVGLFDGRPNFARPVENALGSDFLIKYLNSNVVNPDDKITQVTARRFIEQDPRIGLAPGTFPDSGVATS